MVEDRADIVEINHVYHPQSAKHEFTQIVGWNDGGVDWWRIIQRPVTPRWRRGRWVTEFVDPQDKHLRRVVSTSVWQSWTQHDRELEDRCRRDGKHRRELHRPGKTK